MKRTTKEKTQHGGRNCVYVPTEVHRRAKAHCALNGQSLGDYVTAAIEAALAKRKG